MKPEPQAPNGDWQYANTIIAIVVHVGIMISSSTAFIRRWFPRTRVADIFTPPAVIEEGAAVVAERVAAVAERVAAEGERGDAASERGAAEGERGAAAGERGAAAGERGAAEGERGAAEGERGAARGERKTAEGERKRAEAERERAEAERERAAAERGEAQAARLSLETDRMAAQVYQEMKEEFWKAHATPNRIYLLNKSTPTPYSFIYYTLPAGGRRTGWARVVIAASYCNRAMRAEQEGAARGGIILWQTWTELASSARMFNYGDSIINMEKMRVCIY